MTEMEHAFVGRLNRLAVCWCLIGCAWFLAIMLLVTPETVQSQPNDVETASLGLAGCFSSLMLGCSEEGATSHLLDNGGGKVELVWGSLGPAVEHRSKEYDGARIVRIGTKGGEAWARGKLVLYFRKGHLVGKCVVPDDEKSSADEIYKREIKSGLQHPPNYAGLMEKVHWGKSKEPELPESTRKKDAEGRPIKAAPMTKVRCGIVFEGLPPFAKKQGWNTLVLFQNVGPLLLEEEMLRWGFPVGPVVTAGFAKKKSDRVLGFNQAFGIYGSKVREVQMGDKKMAFRVASYRLEPSGCTFVWFTVPGLEAYRNIDASVQGLMSEGPEGIRIWDSEVELELKP